MKMKRVLSFLVSALTLSILGESSEITQEKTPQFYEYHNRIAVFYPNHITYERIKTESLYVGIEGWVVPTWFTGSHLGIHNNPSAEAEFRMGYNFFWRGREHFTPIMGVGVFSGRAGQDTYILMPYGTFGILYDHEFNRVFNLGMNIKGLIGYSEESRWFWGNPIFGVDTALPMTFRFGYHRRWDFRIEPFNIFLCGQEVDRDYFGFRGTVGFRF